MLYGCDEKAFWRSADRKNVYRITIPPKMRKMSKGEGLCSSSLTFLVKKRTKKLELKNINKVNLNNII